MQLTDDGLRALDDFYAWQYRDKPPLATCPVCAALVPNEFQQIERHAAWHKAQHEPDVPCGTSEEEAA